MMTIAWCVVRKDREIEFLDVGSMSENKEVCQFRADCHDQDGIASRFPQVRIVNVKIEEIV